MEADQPLPAVGDGALRVGQPPVRVRELGLQPPPPLGGLRQRCPVEVELAEDGTLLPADLGGLGLQHVGVAAGNLLLLGDLGVALTLGRE